MRLRDWGVHVYGAGSIALGVVGLFWEDFATIWQPVPAGIPGRKLLAYVAAMALLFAGAAMQRARFARLGSMVAGVLYLIFSALWLRRVIGFPQIYGTWGGFFEQFSLVVGHSSFTGLREAPTPCAR